MHPLRDVQRHAHATRLVQRRAHPGGLRSMQQLVERPPVKKFRDDGEVGRLRHRPHEQNHVRVPQTAHQVHLAGELLHELRREILIQKTFHRHLRPAPYPAMHLAVRTDADAFAQLDRLRRDGQIHRDGEHRSAALRERFFQSAFGRVPSRPVHLLRIRRTRRGSLRRRTNARRRPTRAASPRTHRFPRRVRAPASRRTSRPRPRLDRSIATRPSPPAPPKPPSRQSRNPSRTRMPSPTLVLSRSPLLTSSASPTGWRGPAGRTPPSSRT